MMNALDDPLAHLFHRLFAAVGQSPDLADDAAEQEGVRALIDWYLHPASPQVQAHTRPWPAYSALNERYQRLERAVLIGFLGPMWVLVMNDSTEALIRRQLNQINVAWITEAFEKLFSTRRKPT